MQSPEIDISMKIPYWKLYLLGTHVAKSRSAETPRPINEIFRQGAHKLNIRYVNFVRHTDEIAEAPQNFHVAAIFEHVQY